MTPPNKPGSRGRLPRILGMRDLTLLLIGSVIGSGIFLVPGEVLRHVGLSVELALLAWVVGGVLTLLGALTFGEMSAMRPESGGHYLFIREAFGTFAGFLFGWTSFFILTPGGIAALASAFALNLRVLLQGWVEVSPVTEKLVAVAVIVVLTGVNIRGTRGSADLQNWSTLIKAGALLIMSALLFLLASRTAPEEPAATAGPSALPLPMGFGLAMISVLWAYDGWQRVTFSSGETKDPDRAVPRAFLLGTAALIAIYVLANVAYVHALGRAGLAVTKNAAASSLEMTAGEWAGKAITLAIMVSVFGAANSGFLSGTRVLYAMAGDGLGARRLAEVHERYGTPAWAVGVCGVWAALLAASGTFEQLLTYVVFAGGIFNVLGALALFVYRRRLPDLPRPFRVPGYPFSPLLFALAGIALTVNTIFGAPNEAAVGLGLIAVGVPVYLFMRRGAKPPPQRPSPDN